MLHRLRAVLVRPGRERLVGTVEVDETYIGGRDPGVGRGKGKGDKVLTGIAVALVVNGGTLRHQCGSVGSLHALLSSSRPTAALPDSATATK